MRKSVVLASVALLLCSMFTGQALATPAQGSVWGIYTDRDSFYAAIASNPAQHRSGPPMSAEAKSIRHRQISEALNKAKSEQELEEAANRFGLIIYQPNVLSAMTSDGTSLNYITAPSMIWDSFTLEYEVAGTVEWKDKNAIVSDAPSVCVLPCNIGGRDAISLVFSNWPAAAAITDYYTFGQDSLGGNYWSDSTSDYIANQGTQKAVTVSNYDKLVNNSQGQFDYAWWHTRISFWVKNWDTNVHGLAQTVYAHDWKNTDITGVDFNLSGGSDYKVSAGLVIHFSSTTERWAKQGPDLSY